MGLLTMTASGRMMAVLCDGREETPDHDKRRFASYCGNYRFDGVTLVTRVDASATPETAVGTDQIRMVRFEGELLVLIPPPRQIDDCVEYRELFWERIGSAAS